MKEQSDEPLEMALERLACLSMAKGRFAPVGAGCCLPALESWEGPPEEEGHTIYVP